MHVIILHNPLAPACKMPHKICSSFRKRRLINPPADVQEGLSAVMSALCIKHRLFILFILFICSVCFQMTTVWASASSGWEWAPTQVWRNWASSSRQSSRAEPLRGTAGEILLSYWIHIPHTLTRRHSVYLSDLAAGRWD